MQLKKRFSVRTAAAAGAMAVTMFATSMPVMASSGLGLDAKVRLGLDADFKEVKELQKEIRKDLKDAGKFERKLRFEASATVTDERKEKAKDRKVCRRVAEDAYKVSLKAAQAEHAAAFKVANQAYLAALKSARNAYHASVKAALGLTVSASGTGATGSASGTIVADLSAARKTYRDAVRKAQDDYSAAKKRIRAEYRVDLEAARTTRRAADEACKA
jgi:hypothetical protein